MTCEQWILILEGGTTLSASDRLLVTDTWNAATAEAEVLTLRSALQNGKELVENAYSHVSHGGPTREEALEWTRKATTALLRPQEPGNENV